MGKYLDILKRAGLYDINDRNDQSPPQRLHKSEEPQLHGYLWSFKSFMSYLRRP
jgi:hypothetical protein